ncbi:hypothetical protein SDC9_102654 [bioreactor metagenome]|uniref:Uncharacterized protein n=1 Tax=bioreactor metagenome TaxID=1076179 RepID=A0A645AS05_9ZZZZ
MNLADQRADLGVLVKRAAGLHRFCLRLERGHELLEDRALHVHALGSQAHLACVLEARTGDGRDRVVEVAIRKHQRRVLAAQLQGHGPDAIRARLHDGSTRARLAGERDAVDVGVPGEERPRRIHAKAVDDVVNPLGHAHLVHHLAQQRGRAGRGLRRLDHHRVAAGQRWSAFPGHQQQRQIPRADDGDDATRHAHAIAARRLAVGRAHLERFGGRILDGVCEHLEVGRAARNVHMRCEVRRLARVGNLGLKEVVEAVVDLGHQPVKELAALHH